MLVEVVVVVVLEVVGMMVVELVVVSISSTERTQGVKVSSLV